MFPPDKIQHGSCPVHQLTDEESHAVDQAVEALKSSPHYFAASDTFQLEQSLRGQQ